MKNFLTLRLSSAFLAILFFTLTNPTHGQLEESLKAGEPYYLFPIKPGERNSLAGTMGELRSSHFHTGLDIRTEGRIGLPVQAAASGYISRVAVSTSGYGNALYVTHPNGHTTVYAHLDKFKGPIADYVKKEQYRRETSALNLYFHKDRFSVDRGEIIALSGNSGSSGGPHLHFDIRDKNNDILNPLEYGFNEILDHTPPIAQQVALKTLDKYSRINGQFGRFEFNVRRIGNNYVIDQPIQVYGKIGIELYAYDKLDNSRFRCGIVTIATEVDGNEVFQQQINHLSFSEQRNILKHMDYKELRESGHRYHKLYVDDGNELNIYKTDENLGRLTFTDDCQKEVKIKMIDSYKNVSFVNFKLNCAVPEHDLSAYRTPDYSEPVLIDNTLVVTGSVEEGGQNSLNLYLPEQTEIPPAYRVNDKAIYLWDMKDGLPFSLNVDSEQKTLNYRDKILPYTTYNFYSQQIDIKFPAKSLFDTLYMQSNYHYDSTENLEIFEIGDSEVPLKKYIAVTLKPSKPYSDKYAVYSLDSRNNKYYQGGKWENDRILFWTRGFGRYTIALDSIPPTIVPIKTNSQDLVFKITDDLSGIDEFKCYVNDKWVLMHYDYKRNLIWSERLNDSDRFKGELKLKLTDRSGNKSEYKTNL